MTTVTVRPARPADAAALAELAAATFRLACPPHTTEDAIAAFLSDVLSEARFDEYLTDEQRVVLLAEQADAAVGYTMLVLGDPADPVVAAALSLWPTAELSKCYVRAETHGSGAATLLMRATLHAAKSVGRSEHGWA